ncbi:hypothetical protein IDSA_04340 [Pseudidiomarina salinarum]|uniref:G domain-containing protein n=1 Tax=Pseudidiomarina salinarum TaxID=435908 RepID=A0A094J1J7_9GAMM|nr:GTPase/DUF3482 domain-containing protein [Pseudidiomarina salinarum]KFZ31914.1 hypothetical protein IDSA_04340 [Pseudidiomarina salinarum]RUO70312.1 DUF3482 domain-containing protein [Pseudidiomarina salinarum]
MNASDPIKIAVVGHTNVGKTSLLRTLLQQTDFGVVAASPSSTREVISSGIVVDGEPVLEFFDTPGLEAGTDLYDLFAREFQPEYRHDGPAQVQAFLHSLYARDDFEQEAKVLRQLTRSDAAFYVIDVRDPVLAKFQDELTILMRCGKPLVAVLNFTGAAKAYTREWKQALARVNLHTLVEFDTFSPPPGAEQELFNSLVAVLPAARAQLDAVAAVRREQRQQRRREAYLQLAELLVDVAAYRKLVASGDKQLLNRAVATMQREVKQREQTCLSEIIALYAFRLDTAVLAELNIEAGYWQDDLFSAHTLKDFGLKAGLGVGTGAAAGAGVDLMVGGLSLGAATAIGALVGGVYQGWQNYGSRLRARFSGAQELMVEDTIVALLATRQCYLIEQLARRGHAASGQLVVGAEAGDQPSALVCWQPGKEPAALREARKRPQWSAMMVEEFEPSSARQRQISALQQALMNQADQL